ncbi:hypothetical protein [Sulfobacillus thermosulfidooxidans]|uniref:hypothetical protein n=1 Tax=Sulfobacillus thermosulfidooxidans TaxID=28034 RepID=UPI0003031875|nr:hypothetical protein [Sulfobacillus thermosulfidooxidans]
MTTPHKLFITVDTALIEQPTQLGNQCGFLLGQKKTSYTESEETILKTFHDIPRQSRLATCQTYHPCSEFIAAWRRGEPPFLQDDPICLRRHGDYYVVSEGKHRVCAAIQANIPTIVGHVMESKEPLEWLPSVGEPGTFTAEFVVDLTEQRRTGHVFFLWVDFDKSFYRSVPAFQGYVGFGPRGSTVSENWQEIAPGIRFRHHRFYGSKKRFWHRHRPDIHRIDVYIDRSHPLGKVWLAELPLVWSTPDSTQRIDRYRRGLFRPASVQTVR